MSGTVTDLVVGAGIRFEGRGVQALKGIPGIWRLFAVTDADQRSLTQLSAELAARKRR